MIRNITKQRILLLIPLSLTAIELIYSWTIILSFNIIAEWRQYLGLGLFILVAYLFFKKIVTCTLLLGVYLLLASFNLVVINSEIFAAGIKIGPIYTPSVHPLSLGLFILYLCFNMGSLIDIYLDFNERNEK